MPIKNLSDVRRYPRLGKIRLGVKKTSKEGKEYPCEVDYFVCPDKLKVIFGDKPKELPIMFPIDNDEIFFQQWLKSYGAIALKCKGDGEFAGAWDNDTGGIKTIPCPCEKRNAGECKQLATLLFMIPKVGEVGVWQIDTSSKNSIIDINSSIDLIRRIAGRVNMIPLILKREPRTSTRIEDNKQKKSTHYTLTLNVDPNITVGHLQELAQGKPEMALLPPPDETKDDLLYPANGFKPEEKPTEEEKRVYGAKAGASTIDDLPGGEDEPEISSDLKKLAGLRDELVGIMAQCEESDIEIPQKEWDRVHVLKEEAEYKKAIVYFRAKLTKKITKKDGELF